MTPVRTVRARWMLPITAPPIKDGLLAMADGRIVEIKSAGATKPDLDLGDAVVLPGLVNAHTHLDLGGMRGKLPPTGDFVQWLRGVVGYRRIGDRAEWERAIEAGIRESLLAGTTLLGDISHEGWSAELLRRSPLRSVVFHELIGLTEARSEATQRLAAEWLATQTSDEKTRPGLSPHSPYSVRHSLFEWAERQGVPLAVHYAESREEAELLAFHRGPLRLFLEELGAWDEAGLILPNGLFAEPRPTHRPPVLFIHANYANPKEQIGPSASIVYCPRTHAYFQHARHPCLEFMDAGINVALGTDSLASNPDLSILEEMRFLHRSRPDIAPETLLRMATINGAAALGFDGETGSLAPSMRADWISIPLDRADDPVRSILDSAGKVRDVCINGRMVVRDGQNAPS